MSTDQESPPDAADGLPRMRVTYDRETLAEASAHSDPIVQFQDWFRQALETGLIEPNAMTLATASPGGRPSARLVLLKGLEDGEFVFYTNYASRKGRELAQNQHAALVFYWPELERQVRVEGVVHRVSDERSDAYFASRPRGSRLSAWVSAQSEPLAERQDLDTRLQEVERQFAGIERIPRPPYWGGYALKPEQIEFWQGRQNRLHDRLVYRQMPNGTWTRGRLFP